MKLTNKAAGPRVLNVRMGEAITQRTLAPGESADIEVADADGPVFKAMMEAGEIVEGEEAQPVAKTSSPEDEAGAEAAARAGADAERNTPPAQLGGDGGPEQMPTVDGTPGKPTPAQGEGTPEQKAAGKRRA